MRADLKCLNLTFNEFTFQENFKGKKLKPASVFDSWLTVWHSTYLVNAGLNTQNPALLSEYVFVIFYFWNALLTEFTSAIPS